jgi:hypothetical protein
MIRADYARSPVKPTLDGEPNYEDHPIDPFLRPWQPEYGRFSAYDVRKQAFRAVFAGACGHTYGHHSVWQFWTPQREPINFPMPTWQEAIFRPGAAQMIHLKNLLLSHPYLSRVPAPEMLPDLPEIPAPDNNQHFEPLRASYPVATRCANGTYGLIYFPLAEQSLKVDLRPLKGRVKSQWFDPRNGKSHPAGEHPNQIVTFTSPIAGPDWVLVLESVD